MTPIPRRGRVGKVAVTGYFAPEVRRQLKRLAADADSTVQALLGEALNDLFAKHGVAEIAESDPDPARTNRAAVARQGRSLFARKLEEGRRPSR